MNTMTSLCVVSAVAMSSIYSVMFIRSKPDREAIYNPANKSLRMPLAIMAVFYAICAGALWLYHNPLSNYVALGLGTNLIVSTIAQNMRYFYSAPRLILLFFIAYPCRVIIGDVSLKKYVDETLEFCTSIYESPYSLPLTVGILLIMSQLML